MLSMVTKEAIKEFFKPNKGKIIIAIVIFSIFLFVFDEPIVNSTINRPDYSCSINSDCIGKIVSYSYKNNPCLQDQCVNSNWNYYDSGIKRAFALSCGPSPDKECFCIQNRCENINFFDVDSEYCENLQEPSFEEYCKKEVADARIRAVSLRILYLEDGNERFLYVNNVRATSPSGSMPVETSNLTVFVNGNVSVECSWNVPTITYNAVFCNLPQPCSSGSEIKVVWHATDSIEKEWVIDCDSNKLLHYEIKYGTTTIPEEGVTGSSANEGTLGGSGVPATPVE